jgi:2-dehydro-3-deoxyglucarate aldolase/4-hydroxy-2-oxoheptanedioate aldolase
MKQKLQRGEVVFGQMILELFTPGVAPILANAGLEFVIYDMEHGRCDIQLLSEMITSCRGTGLVPIARVPDVYSFPLSRVLDIGARGVMIPRVETAEQMRDAIAQLKYAPQGRRGVALGLAHDNYQPRPDTYFAQANQDTLVIAIIETARALENLDQIVSTPGLDIAWMGHYDLTVSLGIPAQFSHPQFLGAMDALLASCAKHDVAAGFLPANPHDTAHWIRKGFRAISIGSDVGVFSRALAQFRSAVLEQTGAKA